MTANELCRKIRLAEEPDNPTLIGQWLHLDRCCPRSPESHSCSHCSEQNQRQHHEKQFQLLLDTVMDELLPRHWRCACLDNLYRPLTSIQRLPPSNQGQKLLRELAISSRYAQHSLYL